MIATFCDLQGDYFEVHIIGFPVQMVGSVRAKEWFCDPALIFVLFNCSLLCYAHLVHYGVKNAFQRHYCARKELLVFSYIKVLIKFQELLFVSVDSILFLSTLRGVMVKHVRFMFLTSKRSITGINLQTARKNLHLIVNYPKDSFLLEVFLWYQFMKIILQSPSFHDVTPNLEVSCNLRTSFLLF